MCSIKLKILLLLLIAAWTNQTRTTMISQQINKKKKKEISLTPFFGRNIGLQVLDGKTRYVTPNIVDCDKWMSEQSVSVLCGFVYVLETQVRQVNFVLLDRGDYQCLKVLNSTFYFSISITSGGCVLNLKECSQISLLYLTKNGDCEDDDGFNYFSKLKLRFNGGGYTISFFAKPDFYLADERTVTVTPRSMPINIRMGNFNYQKSSKLPISIKELKSLGDMHSQLQKLKGVNFNTAFKNNMIQDQIINQPETEMKRLKSKQGANLSYNLKIFHATETVEAIDQSKTPYYRFKLFNSVYNINSQCFSLLDFSVSYPIGTRLTIKAKNESTSAAKDRGFFLFKGPTIYGYGSFAVKRQEYDINETEPLGTLENILVIIDNVTSLNKARKSYRVGWFISSTILSNGDIELQTRDVILNADVSYQSQCDASKDILTFEISPNGLYYLYNFCNNGNPVGDEDARFQLGFPLEPDDPEDLHILKNRPKDPAHEFNVYVDLSSSNLS